MIICITGIDGCGKTTQIGLLRDYLEKNGRRTHVSKAYGPTEKTMFSDFVKKADQVSLMFLFQVFHCRQRILAEEALQRGEIVLADRWDESFLAYHTQNGVLSKNSDLRDAINHLAFCGHKPHKTVLLDTPLSVARERSCTRGKDFFDDFSESYHGMMRAGFIQLAKQHKWCIVDGSMDQPATHKKILEVLGDIL